MTMWKDPIKEAKASSASAWGKNRLLARSLLMKSRLYRGFALFFTLMGVVLFINMYLTHIDGHFLEAMRSPSMIVMVVIPFLPAIVLSLMAQKAERDFAALKQRGNTPETPAKK